MKESLSIALIQPTFDVKQAWAPKNGKAYNLNMNKPVAENIWMQIKVAIRNVMSDKKKPNIVLIPELHVAHGYLLNLKEIAKTHGIIIIAGFDFDKETTSSVFIENTARIIIPNNWPNRKFNRTAKVIKFGKTNYTYMEKTRFNNQLLSPNTCKELPEPNIYVLSSKDFGNIGLMICSDFFDIERYMIYQGRIHHLIVLSLNKDTNTYFHLAESLTRLLYANIIVCNSGVYGGTVVNSPYDTKRKHKRTIYKHEGQNLFTYQVVQVPVQALENAQNWDFTTEKLDSIEFKAHPPGYSKPNIQVAKRAIKKFNL